MTILAVLTVVASVPSKTVTIRESLPTMTVQTPHPALQPKIFDRKYLSKRNNGDQIVVEVVVAKIL